MSLLQDVGSVCSVDTAPDTGNTGDTGTRPPPGAGQVALRSGKISLPARMTDLYQTYPDDVDSVHGDSGVPQITLTRPSIVSVGSAKVENK